MAFLVVDDDPIFLTLAEGMLHAFTSETVLTANTAARGLELLSDQGYDIACVLLDLNMPDRDGLSFLRRASYFGYRGQIVISSGEQASILRSAQTLGMMLGLNMAGMLKKPFEVEDFQSVLAMLSEKKAKIGTPIPDNIELTPGHYNLTTYFQPQIDISTGQCSGLEALLRVITEDGAVHGPGKLLYNVKQADQSADLARQVVTAVLTDTAKIREFGHDQIVAINFDASVLEDDSFVAWFRETVRQVGLPPSSICIEVIEKTLPNDLIGFVEKLTRLRIAGFELSLDDFGTGASNFDLLRLCPFSEVKLDRSITEAAVHDDVTRRFMHSTVEIAKSLGLRVVGEGVENERELQTIRSAGIDIAQGFMLSRPLPKRDIVGFLDKISGPLRLDQAANA